jgi:hypothetical protein
MYVCMYICMKILLLVFISQITLNIS